MTVWIRTCIVCILKMNWPDESHRTALALRKPFFQKRSVGRSNKLPSSVDSSILQDNERFPHFYELRERVRNSINYASGNSWQPVPIAHQELFDFLGCVIWGNADQPHRFCVRSFTKHLLFKKEAISWKAGNGEDLGTRKNEKKEKGTRWKNEGGRPDCMTSPGEWMEVDGKSMRICLNACIESLYGRALQITACRPDPAPCLIHSVGKPPVCTYHLQTLHLPAASGVICPSWILPGFLGTHRWPA